MPNKNKDPKKEALMSFRGKAVEQMKKYQDKKFEAEFASKAKMSEKDMYGGKQYTITSPSSSLAGPYAEKNKSKSFKMSPYKLKPVPEGNKGKGLSKLPTEVRNKMGYQMDSSHSFKSNVANNMKTMYMGSVYYQEPTDTEETKKVVVGPDGNLKTETTKIDTKDVVEDVFADNYQGGGTFKNKEERRWYEGQIKQRMDKGMSQEEAVQDYRNTFKIGEKKTEKIGTKTTQKKVETKDLADIGREYQSTGNFGRRQQKRGIIESERKLKRTDIRKARAAADKAGLKGKARREFMRDQKATIKGRQFENQSNRIKEINRQQALQESQGIIGPGGTIKQGFTPGTMKGNYDIRTDSKQSMNRGVSDFNFKSNLDPSKMNVKTPKVNLSLTDMKLSPQAMKHFNRKNKK